MKKILFILLMMLIVAAILHSAYTESIVTSGINASYKRLMFVFQDSLLDSVSPIKMGNDKASPLSMSTTELRLVDDNELSFRSKYAKIYSSGTDKLNIVSAADMTITVPTLSKLYLGTANNYITSDNLTIAGDLGCVAITGTGTITVPTIACATATISGSSTIGTTFGVTGITTLSDVLNSTITNCSGLTTLSRAGTALDVTNNVDIGGTIEVTGVSTLNGVVTATGGVTGDLTGNVTGDLTGDVTASTVTCVTVADSGDAGVTVDGLLMLNGNILLNGGDNFISFDADDNTILSSDTDGEVDFKINGYDDFTFSANLFTALDESAIKTNTISETTLNEGVSLESAYFESKASFYSIFAPHYVGFVDNDDETNPSSRNLSGGDDVYIGGILEVDGNTFLDGGVTTATLNLSGDNPEINPSTQDSADGKNLIIQGGDGLNNGGDLFLDGGDATTDGDVILGKNYGNVDIQTFWGESDCAITSLTGNITDVLTVQTSIFQTTTNDTVTIGGTPFEGMIKQYIAKSVASGSILIEAGYYDCLLDADGETVRYKYTTGVWYIIGKNN